MDGKAILEALQAQRNQALDMVAQLHGVIAEKDAQLAQKDAAISELMAKLEPKDAG